MRKRWAFIVPAALLGMVLFIFIGGEIVKLLWNWLTPPLFGLPVLTFWQALAMLAICRILFGGFGMHGGGGPRVHRYRVVDRITDRMADRFTERWQSMTPDQRERFRQRVRERCGFDPAAGDAKAQ